ncbi:hypothetical protein C3L33_03870, partial [Rhododendron williamsianum]
MNYHYSMVLGCLFVISCLVVAASAGNFNQDFKTTFGGGRANIQDSGNLLTLSLDQASGSGFQSVNQYMYGKFDIQMKLVPGNSAGTVTTYYLSSVGSGHDEIDLEFLGNLSGDPYVLHTNVFAQGKGDREQQFYLCISVDGTPIRQFKNMASNGVSFPNGQPMWIYSSLWDAEDWATRGGLVKTDWSQAPFTASYRNYTAQACIWSSTSSSSSCTTSSSRANSWMSESLDNTGQARIKWVQNNYMIYNYCTDAKRFPQGFPPEC